MSRGGRRSSDYTRCPDCQCRTVLFHFGRKGDDFLRCTRCRWETFRFPERGDSTDGPAVRKWEDLNQVPLHERADV